MVAVTSPLWGAEATDTPTSTPTPTDSPTGSPTATATDSPSATSSPTQQATSADPSPSSTPTSTQLVTDSCGTVDAPCYSALSDGAGLDTVLLGLGVVIFLLAAILAAQLRRP